ncbi:MAG: NAD(P)-dependent oxidoreductase [Verrucomicrobiota bacterium]
MSKPHIAFLGLGIMGSGMARQLLAKGFPLSVYNRNPDKSKPLGKEGALVATTPAEAAAHAGIIISMLADDNASRSLWLGDNGALSKAAPGALCIECGTVTVDWIKELSAAAAQHGCELIDAPVTGSKAQALAGELNFLVGGTSEALEKARPVLSAMGRNIIHLGATGSGALVKLINNFVCGVQIASLAEALTMIERSGIDRASALEVMANGAPGSPLFKALSGRMTARDYVPHFLLRLMAKDLGYALSEGEKLSINLTTASAALGLFQQGVASGQGEKDIAAVIEPFRNS